MDAPSQFDAADVLKQEQRPLILAEFPQRHGQAVLPWVRAKLAKHQRCGNRAVLDRRGEAENLVPMARVSTHDQQTLPMQLSAMRSYARKRGWTVAVEVNDVGSGATARPLREKLIETARRREIDSVLVWRLDRWGRSLVDLVNTLQELTALDVGFVSLSEALDLTTPSGRALAGMLAVFAERDILRDRVKAGIDQARKDGKPHGRPMTAGKLVPEMKQLRKNGISKRAIAKQLGVSRTSVIRLLRSRKRS
jgi:putative DNA-invertase from lambdoid prophage Rac